MVEADGRGGLVITMRQVNLWGVIGTGASAIIAGIAFVIFTYANLENAITNGLARHQEDLGRVWQAMADRKQIEDTLATSIESLRTLYNAQQGRLAALSENIRIVETTANSISSNLAATTRDQTLKIDAVLTKEEELGVGLARVEAALKYMDAPRPKSGVWQQEGHQ